MEWTGYDRVFGLEDPMKSSKMTWRRLAFQWIVLDATGPRSCDWLRKEKKPFDDLWLHGVMPCKVPSAGVIACACTNRLDIFIWASQFDTIRFTFFTFPFLLLFLLPMFQNSKTRLEDGGHHIAHIQLLTLPQSLNQACCIAQLCLAWLFHRSFLYKSWIFQWFVLIYNICNVRHLRHLWHWQVISKVWTCSVGAWSGCRTSRIACSGTGLLSFSCYLCVQKPNLQNFTRNNSNKISTFNHYPEKSNIKIYLYRNIHS